MLCNTRIAALAAIGWPAKVQFKDRKLFHRRYKDNFTEKPHFYYPIAERRPTKSMAYQVTT
jgi:hypothetical protein